MTVYRLSRTEHSRVLRRLGDVGEAKDLPAIIASLLDVVAEVFTVEFEDGQVLEPRARRAEWEGFSLRSGVLGLPSSTSDAEEAAWWDRARRFADVIGLDQVSDELLRVQTGKCGAVFLVAANAGNG